MELEDYCFDAIQEKRQKKIHEIREFVNLYVVYVNVVRYVEGGEMAEYKGLFLSNRKMIKEKKKISGRKRDRKKKRKNLTRIS
jgi:hypothetical protein